MKNIKILKLTGHFAEDKDIAKRIRTKEIIPELNKEESVTLDFKGIDIATQSFIHALISELIRNRSSEVLEKINFKNFNNKVKEIIKTVVDYMQI